MVIGAGLDYASTMRSTVEKNYFYIMPLTSLSDLCPMNKDLFYHGRFWRKI